MINFEKIILVAVSFLIIVALVFGVIIFRQQKTINALSGGGAGTSKQSAAKKDGPSQIGVIKQFYGSIESISGNQMTIRIKLVDFSKPKKPEMFKNSTEPMNLTGDDFEKIEKVITVITNEKTVFTAKKLTDLKNGDTISIDSDKSPYMADTVTALKVTSGMTK